MHANTGNTQAMVYLAAGPSFAMAYSKAGYFAWTSCKRTQLQQNQSSAKDPGGINALCHSAELTTPAPRTLATQERAPTRTRHRDSWKSGLGEILICPSSRPPNRRSREG